MSENSELEDKRRQIDELDARIVAAICQRLQIAGEIGRIKSEAKAPAAADAADFAREEQVIRSALAAASAAAAAAPAIGPVMREIVGLCMAQQRPLQVAYLGPAGTFSNEAARARFGSSAELLPATSLAGCLKMVEAEAADYALIPFENSIEGGVGEAMDEIASTGLIASAETCLRVRQCLLAAAGTKIDGIRSLYSHPQSFGQCRRWLDANLGGCSRVACASNAEAAGRNLQVLASAIEDNSRNITRFLVMGRKQARPSGDDRTSVIFAVRHRPGALLEMLRIIAEARVNMTKLQSRPMPGGSMGQGQYLFFVDMDGHHEQPPLAAMLPCLQREAAMFKLIGSYPREAPEGQD